MTIELILTKILHYAEVQPEKIALKFFEGDYFSEKQLNYRELKEKIIAYSQVITSYSFTKQKSARQHPILLIFDSSLDYIVSFLATLHSGNIAVTAYPPRQTRHLERLLKIIEDSQVEMILTTAKVKNYCDTNHFMFPNADLICVDMLDIENSSIASPSIAQPDDIAFLQYTSGSTGSPKGVIVTHRNLHANLNLLVEYLGESSINTCVSWLPIFHDMGLIGNTLLPLYRGGTCAFMAPLTFLKNPFFWLQKISEEKGSYTMAPNFAYDLSIDALEKNASLYQGLDFSSVCHLVNGAEPVKPNTVRRIEEKLKTYNLAPGTMKTGYGMAETTLVISLYNQNPENRFLLVDKEKLSNGRVRPHSIQGEAVELVRCGKVSNHYSLKIVDPTTRKELPTQVVGELWLQATSVAAGYYRNSEKTAEIFNAFTAGGDGPFLRTGDLAFIDEQNYLVICGRVKDLIIINGRNIYPQDVELACYQADSNLIQNGAAAFSIVGTSSEECVVVAEVNRHLEAARYSEILNKIKKAVFEATDVVLYDILLIPPRKILKTTSGKIQRSACKHAYTEGQFNYLARLLLPEKFEEEKTNPTVTIEDNKEVVSWLKQWIANNSIVRYDDIDEQRAFAEFGLTSIKLVTMVNELEQFIQQPLDPWLAWEYSTIFALSQHIVKKNKEESRLLEKDYEPIAVIGMDCRIPGSHQTLENVDEFWKFLQGQEDSIRPIPKDRWDNRQFYDADPQKKGMMYSTAGSFLTEIKRFDTKFFNIAPREAEYLDPQQRLALMVSWHALEDAGIVPADLSGTHTGIYLGISTHDYDALIQKHVPLEELTTYQATGTSFSTSAGRIAYFLGTHGPCLAIDTACSSSLVSIHQACRALQDGECDLALAGGVNVILSPETNIIFCKTGMLSPKNRCSTFDSEADGYVRGEGCGMVVLKRLKDALRDQNKIYAVVRSSVVNQDGASNGLTAPNLQAQVEVMQDAIKLAHLTPEQITHIEAHGTGTSLGDPIEWESIRRAYALARKTPLYITSLKTRIGHLEAAAGIASFIKTVLAIKYGQIPSHLHLKQFNPKITPQETMHVPTQSQTWQMSERYAGVSSFGFSGTNAHIILENARFSEPQIEQETYPYHLWVVSAREEIALKNYLEIYRQYSKNAPVDFAAMCQQVISQRTHFAYRAFIVAKDRSEWQKSLEQGEWQQGEVSDNNKLVWLFTGQGCLHPRMAAQLYKTLPLFKLVVDHCCSIANPLLSYDLHEVLLNTPEHININHTRYAQPALFVYEYALAKWFLSLGIRPHALIGHSLGEYVAACVAEILSLEDALRLVCIRAELIASLPEEGAMLAVAVNSEKTENLLLDFPDLVIAVKNSPQQTVVSGPREAIEALKNYCAENNLRCTAIATSHAFHSPLMQPIVADFYKETQKVTYNQPKIALISNVTGLELNPEEINAQYWCEHLLKTVNFYQGLQTLMQQGINLYQEIGPKPVLTAQIQLLGDFTVLPSVMNAENPWPSLLQVLGVLYLRGWSIDWSALYLKAFFHKESLPKYPFAGKDYWLPAFSQQQNTSQGQWRKNLYQVQWQELNWHASSISSTQKIAVMARTESKIELLNFLLKQHDITTVRIAREAQEATILAQLKDASHFIYCCEADEEEVISETIFLARITQLLIKNKMYKSFIFLNANSSVVGTALLALLKSIKQEYPQWSVHYREGTLEETDKNWVNILLGESENDWILRYENQRYYSLNIVPLMPELILGNKVIYPDNSYLITGACGDIGQVLIEELLQQGVKTIVAVGRRKKPGIWSPVIQSYLKHDAQIHYYCCNIAEANEVERLIGAINKQLPPLVSVIHAAGVTIDKPWLAMQETDIRLILEGKALGAFNLHRATASCELKEFICISSIAGVLGSQGQAAYATANAFLDALTDLRQQQGKPGLNWILGPVKNTGLFKKNEESLTPYLASLGIAPITQEVIRAVVKEKVGINKVIVANFLNDNASATHEEAMHTQTSSNDSANITPTPGKKECRVDDILHMVQKILKADDDSLSRSHNWFEAGMDSIMATQLVHQVNKKYKDNIVSFKDIFQHASAEELATQIQARLTDYIAQENTFPTANTIPLSLQQQEVWNFLNRCQDKRAYQIPMEIKIEGTISREKFEYALKQTMLRHDIFRYGFHKILHQVNQHIHQDVAVCLEYSDNYDAGEVAEFLLTPIDLKQPPLIRNRLIRVNEQEHRWLIVFHHLICDGNTVTSFIQEVMSHYDDQQFEEKPQQYSDYVYWQWNNVLDLLDGSLKDYWLNYLKDIPLSVPFVCVTHCPMEARVISASIPLENLNETLEILEKNKLSLSNFILAHLFDLLLKSFKREKQGIVVFFSGREDGNFTSVFGDTSSDVVIVSHQCEDILQHAQALQEQILSRVDKQYLRMPMLPENGLEFPEISFDFQRGVQIRVTSSQLKVTAAKSGNVQNYLWGEMPRLLSFKALLEPTELKLALKYRADKIRDNLAQALLMQWMTLISNCIQKKNQKINAQKANLTVMNASILQQNLWQLLKSHPNGMPYYIPLIKELEKDVDLARLDNAMRICISKHPALRTYFTPKEEKLELILTRKEAHLPLKQVKTNKLYQTLGELLLEPIAIDSPPLLRWYLVLSTEEKPILLIRIHHLVCDGLSAEIFFQELEHYYLHPDETSIIEQDSSYLNHIAADYKNYELRLNDYTDYLASVNLTRKQDTFLVKETYYGGVVYQQVMEIYSKKIADFCHTNKISLYTFYLHLFCASIAKYWGNKEVYISIVKSNRTHLEHHNIVGYYADNIPLLVSINDDPLISQLQALQIKIVELVSRFEFPFLLQDMTRINYKQPQFIFNQYSLIDPLKFNSADYVFETIIQETKQVALWNYSNPERCNLMVRSSSQGDILGLIFNPMLVTEKEAQTIMDMMISELLARIKS
ncbi:SDR family NAD(P)-dependent oxidoreductase [Legionella sp. 227]|uniref:SDR family NAD(P)-dependent oxidoreductase n=1 Tax=Legionella sp. 227 TaxID=3367288 RepID=UPI00370DD6BD